MSSIDRLSLSGLMLKPVQRFPQFIMIIKVRNIYITEPLCNIINHEECLYISHVYSSLNRNMQENRGKHA